MMPIKSQNSRYGAVAVATHWATALMILGLLASGFVVADMQDGSGKTLLLAVHVPMGVLVLTLTLFRIAWWRFADRKPDAMGGLPRWQLYVAGTVHTLLYVIVLVMAGSGIGMVVLSQAAPIIFGAAPPPLPDFTDYPPRIPHGIGARMLAALLVAHVGAALYHQFLRRDRLLARMGIGKPLREVS